MTTVELSPGILLLIRKLAQCQDSKTGAQSFLGTVRVIVLDDVATVHVEETVWETESGDHIDTSVLRAQ